MEKTYPVPYTIREKAAALFADNDYLLLHCESQDDYLMDPLPLYLKEGYYEERVIMNCCDAVGIDYSESDCAHAWPDVPIAEARQHFEKAGIHTLTPEEVDEILNNNGISYSCKEFLMHYRPE